MSKSVKIIAKGMVADDVRSDADVSDTEGDVRFRAIGRYI